MKNRDALIVCQEIIEQNLKDNNTPKRADISQTLAGYPMEHAITVLKELINTFKFEETT